MLKLSKIISEIKNVPKIRLEKGKEYDVKVWWTGDNYNEPGFEHLHDIYIPTDGTRPGEEGVYWLTDCIFEGESEDDYLFSDGREPQSFGYMHIPFKELKTSDIRSHKNLSEIKNIYSNSNKILVKSLSSSVFEIIDPRFKTFGTRLFIFRTLADKYHISNSAKDMHNPPFSGKKSIMKILTNNNIPYTKDKEIFISKENIQIV